MQCTAVKAFTCVDSTIPTVQAGSSKVFFCTLLLCCNQNRQTKEMLAKEEENACLGLGTLVLQFAKASLKVLHQRLGAILLPLGYIATP